MKLKGLLIAVAVLVALGGALYWSDKKQKADENKPAADASPKILKLEAADIKKVELKRKDGETVVLVRDNNNQWSITQPQPMRADQDAVNSMVNTLASLGSDKLVDDKPADLSAFGLNAPALEVTLTKKDGGTAKVLVGDDTPTGGGAHPKAASDPKVYTVASVNKSSFDKSANDLRDKRLLTVDSDKLSRVELIAKGQDIEFGKNSKGDWTIIKPKPMRADTLQVDEFVRKLKDAKMETGADKPPAGGALVGTAKVTDNSGTQQLEVRKVNSDYYAKSSVVEGLHKIPADLGAAFDKKLDDFRNKKVFDFGFSDVTKLDIRDGAKTYSFQKSGDKWKSGSQDMDTVGVQSLVDKLREASATKILDAGSLPAAIEVNVTYGTSTEKVLFAKSGDKTLAKRDNEPAVYELDGKFYDELQKAVTDVKPAQPAADAKKK